MKNILMSTAALAGLALVAAAPARADEPALQLGLGGYVSGYAVYTDQDEIGGDEFRKFDFRKDTEVHLNGEVALDNGITAGAHLELLMDRADDQTVEESYLYLSSSWGRVNLGEEDGIAYLLQVGAPSADDKIDGIRPDIGTFADGTAPGGTNLGGTLDYAQDPFGYANKLTYITPVFNGFQAGVSFTPSVSDADLAALSPAALSEEAGELENGWEVAARYEGSFDAIDLALGAGYSSADLETDGAGDDDFDQWNVGANLGWGAFGIGAVYLDSEGGVGGADVESNTWVAGIDYTTGPYKIGASYLNSEVETGAGDAEADRWTAGAIYEWGPGMTFRGAVQFQDAEAGGDDADGTQVTLGTQLEF